MNVSMTARFVGDGGLGLLRGGADVVGAVKAGQLEDRIVELGLAAGRFGVENVQAGAQAPALDGL